MKYPYEEFKEDAVKRLAWAIKELYNLGIPREKIEEKIEKPKRLPKEAGKRGLKRMPDLAYPCFHLSNKIKVQMKTPLEIAMEISKKIKGSLIKKIGAKATLLEDAKEIGAYVNFYINNDLLAEKLLKQINETRDDFGKGERKNKSIILEHTSANPNGPLHVGRARNPIIGDTLARIFKFAGYDTETQFYVDDIGKQVAILLWGLKNLDIKAEEKKDDHRLVIFYQKAYEMMEKNEKVKEQIGHIIKKCEEGDEKILESMKEAYEKALGGILESLERINIKIDSFVDESKFILDGSVQYIIERLKKSKFAGYDDNALYLDMEPFGIHGRNKKFFLTRKDDTSLYATRDIAYHLWKEKRTDMMVNILGEDHKLEAKLVETTLKILGAKVPNTVFYSFVSLPEGKMSTRRGRTVYLDELIEESVERAYREVMKRRELPEERARFIAEKVGVGAVRYNIVKVNPEKAITFRWEEAMNFEGESAPFIQYAHARCCSIVKKSGKEKIDISEINFSNYNHPQEISLIKMLASFPEITKKCQYEFNPAFLADYAYGLATSFNVFYRDCHVVGSEKEKERIALVHATRQTLKNALNLLGIEALEEM